MKVRVYEVAQDLGLDNKAAVALFESVGADVRNHMSCVLPQEVEAARRRIGRTGPPPVEERILPTVVKRSNRLSSPRRPLEVGQLPKYGWAAVPKVDVDREIVVTIGKDALDESGRGFVHDLLSRNEWGPFIVRHSGPLTEVEYARGMPVEFRCRFHDGKVTVSDVIANDGRWLTPSEEHMADVYAALLVLSRMNAASGSAEFRDTVLEEPNPEDPTRVVVIRLSKTSFGATRVSVGSRKAPAPHMRRAHRRKQPCGPRGMDRKTIWVQASSVRGGRTWGQYRVVE